MHLFKKFTNIVIKLSLAIFSIYITHYLWTEGSYHPTIVCQILVVSYALFFNKHEDVFIVSSMGGMTFPNFFFNPGFIALSGFFSFFLCEIFHLRFLGFGGKFGFLALCSNSLACLIIFCLTQVSSDEYFFPLFDYEYYTLFLHPFIMIGPFITAFSCCFSFLVEPWLKHRNKVVAINVIGALFSIGLSCFKFKLGKFVIGDLFCNFNHVGILIALTKQEHIDSLNFFRNKKIIHYFCMSFFAGWIWLLTNGIMTLGGKNGSAAFLMTNFYLRTFGRKRNNKNKKEERGKCESRREEGGKEELEIKIDVIANTIGNDELGESRTRSGSEEADGLEEKV